MKLSASDIAVLLLAACIPLTIVAHTIEIMVYGQVENSAEYVSITEHWMKFLTFVAGGVFGWVVPKSNDEK